jgi:putative redox protein
LSDSLSVSAVLSGPMAFRAITGSGHEAVMDAAPDVGGQDQAARPMELILAGLAGCTGMDVISILRKMHQDVTSYEVRVTGNRVAEHPRVYSRIAVEHVVTGRNLAREQVARAVELSSTRYCPASAMLGKTAEIEHTITLVEA